MSDTTSELKKPLAIVMVMLLTTFIGFGIVIPVMPELIKSVHAELVAFHTGMMLTVYSAMSFFLSPLWGGLSDRIGRRPVVLIGILGFAISFILFGLGAHSLVLMYVSRVLGGLFAGAVTSVIVAYVADVTPPEKRTRGMGLVGMSIGLGFTIGPGVGGLLSGISLEAPFYAAGGLALLTFLFAITRLKESLPVAARRLSKEKAPSRWSAFAGSIRYLYILAFFVAFSLAGLEATLQLFGMERFDVTPGQVGFMFLVCGVMGVLVQGGIVRRYIRKGEEPRYIAAGLVISAAGFVLLLFAHELWSTTAALAVFGIGNALIRPCVTSLITQQTTVGVGTASGLSSSMDSLGRIIGPLSAAYLFTLQITLPFLVGAVLSLAALLLLGRFLLVLRSKTASAS